MAVVDHPDTVDAISAALQQQQQQQEEKQLKQQHTSLQRMMTKQEGSQPVAHDDEAADDEAMQLLGKSQWQPVSPSQQQPAEGQPQQQQPLRSPLRQRDHAHLGSPLEQLARLEAEKNEAVANEDYDRAQDLKREIATLTEAGASASPRQWGVQEDPLNRSQQMSALRAKLEKYGQQRQQHKQLLQDEGVGQCQLNEEEEGDVDGSADGGGGDGA
jgi:hypothetical protein